MKIIIVKQGTIMKNFGNEIKNVMFSKAMIWREVVFMNWSDVYRKKTLKERKYQISISVEIWTQSAFYLFTDGI